MTRKYLPAMAFALIPSMTLCCCLMRCMAGCTATGWMRCLSAIWITARSRSNRCLDQANRQSPLIGSASKRLCRMRLRMLISPCGCGKPLNRACIKAASPGFMKPSSGPWCRSWRTWKWPALKLTAIRCRACPMPLPRKWRGLRPRYMSLPVKFSMWAAPSNWARSCLTNWAMRAAKRAKPAPMPRGRMF